MGSSLEDRLWQCAFCIFLAIAVYVVGHMIMQSSPPELNMFLRCMIPLMFLLLLGSVATHFFG